MDIIVLTENETERDKWVAIIEELQKAIRSKQMTQVGQACCGSRLMSDALLLHYLHTYLGLLVPPSPSTAPLVYFTVFALRKYRLIEYRTICVNCVENYGWKMFMDIIRILWIIETIVRTTLYV